MNGQQIAGVHPKRGRLESGVCDVAVADKSLGVGSGQEFEGDFEHAVLAFQFRRRGGRRTCGETRAHLVCRVSSTPRLSSPVRQPPTSSPYPVRTSRPAVCMLRNGGERGSKRNSKEKKHFGAAKRRPPGRSTSVPHIHSLASAGTRLVVGPANLGAGRLTVEILRVGDL